MKQRTDITTWFDISPGNLVIDQFPDGSFRFSVEGLNGFDDVFITLKTTLPEAIVALHQVCTAVVAEFTDIQIHIEVQTFPDQRADRIEKPGMTNAALVSARLVALTPCSSITVHDLHSSTVRTVLETMCNNYGVELVIYEPLDDFLDTLTDVDPEDPRTELDPSITFDYFVAVDKGARHRAETIAKHFGGQVIYCDKKRVDGKVVGHVLDGTLDWPMPATANIWVVDDLCDGGATFISVAELLRRSYNFHDLHLYVTHGLFSKGKDELYKHFTTILARFDHDAA